jgi:hypothetical protein
MYDVQKDAPKGYEIIGIRRAECGDYYLTTSKEMLAWNNPVPSNGHYVILKEKEWVPKYGEVIAVWDGEGFKEWTYAQFYSMEGSGVRCEYLLGNKPYSHYRKLSKSERGE